MFKKISKIAFCTALSASLLATTAYADKANDTLNVAWDLQLTNADAYFNSNREGILLARMVWDQLLVRDPDTFKYKPGLAKTWRWVDELTLEFDLREGITFHNGEAFDADDVVYTINYISNPDNKVLNQTLVSWIKNAEKIDQFKVRINLSKTFPSALEYISGPMPIYPNEYYAEVGPEGMAQAPIGTGPYKVESIVSGESIHFVKNDNYWEDSPKGKPEIGNVVVTYPADKTTQLAGLVSGQLDWIWHVPTDQVDSLGAIDGIDVSSGETMRVSYMYFDSAGRSGDTPLTDVRVRQAIAHSINREEFVTAFFPPSAKTVKAVCYTTQFGCYQGATQYEYDLDKAKALMADAGYSDGFKTTIYAFRQPPSWVEALAGYMNEIGIEVDIQLLQYSAFRTKVHEGEAPISFGDWGSYSINDASAILGNFFSGSPDDYTGDKDLKEWVSEAATNSDPSQREALYKRSIEAISENAYALPLNSYGIYYGYTSELHFRPFRDEIPRYYLYSWK